MRRLAPAGSSCSVISTRSGIQQSKRSSFVSAFASEPEVLLIHQGRLVDGQQGRLQKNKQNKRGTIGLPGPTGHARILTGEILRIRNTYVA